MALEVEATKAMADTEKNSNQNGLTVKKLKRMLEMSSVVCSAASISMVIACQYGGVPNIFGFKSLEMIFDLAFSLIVASVVFGILAMAASRIQDRKLGIYFPAFRISALFSSLLTALLFFKNKDTASCESFFKPANSQAALNPEGHVHLKGGRGNQEYSNSLDNLSINTNEDAEYSLNNAGKSTVFSPSSDESSEIKSYPQLQKFHAPFLFGQCSVAQSPIRSTESLQFMQFDCEQMKKKKSQLVSLPQKTFATNGNFNEVNTINMSEKRPQVGVVSPIRISNSNDVEYCDLYKNISSSVESIHTWQKQPRQRLNRNSLEEHQSFYQNASRIPVDSNSQYESNSPMKAFHNFPNSQQEIFSKRLHTDVQNLHDVQSKFLNVRCHDSRELSYSYFQTTPESSHKFPYKVSEMVKFNSHKIQEGYAEDHSYKLHRSVTPNFKSFQLPSRDFKEVPHSQIRMINAHCGRNINSGEWDENFDECFDVPMEICDKVPNDRILEVSKKLNDLSFMF